MGEDESTLSDTNVIWPDEPDPAYCDLCGKRADIYGMRHKECVKQKENGMIAYANGTLWGAAGGQLEYVSQRLRYDKVKEMPMMVLRFTDHDHAMNEPEDAPDLIDGKFYDLEFPMEPCDVVEPKSVAGDFFEAEADRLNREACEKDVEILKLKEKLAKAAGYLKECNERVKAPEPYMVEETKI